MCNSVYYWYKYISCYNLRKFLSQVLITYVITRVLSLASSSALCECVCARVCGWGTELVICKSNCILIVSYVCIYSPNEWFKGQSVINYLSHLWTPTCLLAHLPALARSPCAMVTLTLPALARSPRAMVTLTLPALDGFPRAMVTLTLPALDGSPRAMVTLTLPH